MEITREELYDIIGGATSYTSSTFINAASRMISTLLTLGQIVGSSIRRIVSK